jgi:rod shape-determining protein MreC
VAAVTLSRRTREAAAIAALLAVGVLVLRASGKRPSDLNWLDRTVLRASAPVQAGLTSAGRALAGAFRGYVWLVDVKRDNARLADENRRLRAELESARLEGDRAGKLERLLGLREAVPSEMLAARVVGVDTSPYFRVLRVRLDRGAGEVKPGMVVLVPEGVVGRVGRVFGPYCDVTLAVDPDSAIDVQVARSGARGVLKGSPGGVDYAAHVPEMPRGDDVRAGDELVTSGIGGFPRAIPVGRVAKVARPDSGLWQEVTVAPSVDFARLAEVQVVLAPPPPPDPEAGTGHRAAEPHRGLRVPR